ncbi:unnamed protein product [Clavelina lepadiformis]|uniref:Uncharacterized protein n=1 Tax=Clavelina lepadiformis TaxID=159417 RepID=A0ABP0G4F7_CLALP
MKLSGIIRSFTSMVVCLNHLSIVTYDSSKNEVKISKCYGDFCPADKCYGNGKSRDLESGKSNFHIGLDSTQIILFNNIAPDVILISEATTVCSSDDEYDVGEGVPGSGEGASYESLVEYARPPYIQSTPVNACDEHRCLEGVNCIESDRHVKDRYCVSRKCHIGDGDSITTPFIGASATDVFIRVSQDVYRDFDQGVDNNQIFFSSTFYTALDDKCKAVVQGNHYVMPSCPAQCPTSYDVSNGHLKRCTKSQSEFCSHNDSAKRCRSVQNLSIIEQHDERKQDIDLIYSFGDQDNKTTTTNNPEDGAIRYTANNTEAEDGNKISDNNVATHQPIDVSSWMRLFADCLFFTFAVTVIALLLYIILTFSIHYPIIFAIFIIFAILTIFTIILLKIFFWFKSSSYFRYFQVVMTFLFFRYTFG